ncbi:MAG: hypothetical protein M1819_004719 [Sarea resinae]|nr:MAG: hypothetical protein M1819_004719 [Sarea resinae]
MADTHISSRDSLSPKANERRVAELAAIGRVIDESSTSFPSDYEPNPEEVSDGSEDEDLELFRPVIDAIDFDALASVAMRIRGEQETGAPVQEKVTQSISCYVNQDSPILGSYHLVYFLTFSDGLRWVVRIPGNAVSTFGKLDVERLDQENQMMRHVRSVTSMPIPNVFFWETSSSTIGVPYTLMSFVCGISVLERWSDKSWITEAKRLTILRNLARVVSQLHVLQFDKIGTLSFDVDGNFSHIGDLYTRTEPKIGDCKEEETWGFLTSHAPYDDTRTWLMDEWDGLERSNQYSEAELAIMRLAADSIPGSVATKPPFVLSPPDFDSQNVFIDENCNITGIIDWDNTITQPRIAGFARYPSWITRDWDPCMYGYPIVPAEDSPEQLSRYRQEYARAFDELHLPAAAYSSQDTLLSHIFEAIDLGISSAMCRSGIVYRLLEHAFDSKVPFSIREYYSAFEDQRAELYLIRIKEAFRTMWHP